MGWETPARGRKYYTRSRRVGGRVIREYVGAGSKGELGEAEDARRRAERAARVANRKQEAASWEALQEQLLTLFDSITLLHHASLAPAGYYQHNKGAWRLRKSCRK